LWLSPSSSCWFSWGFASCDSENRIRIQTETLPEEGEVVLPIFAGTPEGDRNIAAAAIAIFCGLPLLFVFGLCLLVFFTVARKKNPNSK